jgi:Fe-S oxidoreductase
MEMENLRSVLDWDNCKECGECLVNCRYMNLSRQDAIDEIKKINKRDLASSKVLKKCISCYACDAFCPNGAHPYERIHYNWDYRYKIKGLPMRASYLMPSRQPNFRENLPFSPKEKALHKKWASDVPPAKVVLYPGCNLLSMPRLAEGAIFERLPVWGRWDLCCGEMYFRMGLLEPTARIAEKLTEFYKDKNLDEMVFICPAGYNMFTNVLPKQFGAKFPFKTTFFTDWFLNELDKGTFTIKHKLNKSVVMHDSCHARVLGDEFMDKQRILLKQLGVTIHETPKNKKHGLCCGVAAGTNRYSVFDLSIAGIKEIFTLDRASGDDIVAYCTGCLLTLSCFRLLNPFGKRLVHPLEYVREAIGEKVTRTNQKKAFWALLGIMTHALPAYLNPKRFYV